MDNYGYRLNNMGLLTKISIRKIKNMKVNEGGKVTL